MSTPHLRLIRPAPDPLGLYVRAGRIDQKDLQSFITTGAAAFTGVVFEAKHVAHQQELLSLVLERGLDAVLDPQTQAMATIGGYAKGMDDIVLANALRAVLERQGAVHVQIHYSLALSNETFRTVPKRLAGPTPRNDATRLSPVTRSRAWHGAAGADKPRSMTHHLPIHRHRGMP